MTAPSNQVEDAFREVKDRKEAEAIFAAAKGADEIGACIFKDTQNVLPLFAGQAGIDGIGLCFSKKDVYCIRAGQGIEVSWLLEQLEGVAKDAGRFAMFDIKELWSISALPARITVLT